MAVQDEAQCQDLYRMDLVDVQVWLNQVDNHLV